MGAGRPSIYKSEMCSEAIELGGQGKSLTQIAVALGVSKDTLYTWVKEKPEFSDAIQKARAAAQAWWEERGQLATDGEIPGFNATAWVFTMKNRFRDDYADRKELSVESTMRIEDKRTFDPAQLTDEQREVLKLTLQRALAPPPEEAEWDEVD